MNTLLMNAILSMDSYNRGYNPGISFGSSITYSPDNPGTKIGNATVIANSTLAFGTGIDSAIGFYGIAYDYNGQKIIAFRGTDDKILDPLYGWAALGGLNAQPQAKMAFDFYNTVATSLSNNTPIDPRNANISVTGHSLGGGLAGLVGAVYNKSGLLFDSMTYSTAADDAFEYSVFHSAYKNSVYGAITPWDTTITSGAYLTTIELQGQILGLPFVGAAPQTLYNLGYIPPSVSSGAGGYISGVDLHSMSSLVMAIFKQGGYYSSADKAAPYFWPVLYDNAFANSIGVNATSVPGQAINTHDFAGVLRSIIAYSAIDEGERPYGDTAIYSLYNDMDRLGRVSSTFSEFLNTSVSKLAVQFAGVLALQDVEWSQTASAIHGGLAPNAVYQRLGILQTNSNNGYFFSNNTLTVNLSDELWGIGGTVPVNKIGEGILWNEAGVLNIFVEPEAYAIVAYNMTHDQYVTWVTDQYDRALDNALANNDWSALSFSNTALVQSVATLAGITLSDIKVLQFAESNGPTYTLGSPIVSTGSISLFVTPNTNDTIQIVDGTGMRDLIITGNENIVQDLRGGDGDDILIGGAYGDFLKGGDGNDVLAGGDGNDNYIWAFGDDDDLIFDTGGALDVLTMDFSGSGLHQRDIMRTQSGNDLIVSFASISSALSSSILITDYFGSGHIETLDFKGLLNDFPPFPGVNSGPSIYDDVIVLDDGDSQLGELGLTVFDGIPGLIENGNYVYSNLNGSLLHANFYSPQTGQVVTIFFNASSPYTSQQIIVNGTSFSGLKLFAGAGPGDDYIDGGQGQNQLTAGAGNDTVYTGYDGGASSGGDGNDYMEGNGFLFGGAGNDVLVGGGNSVMLGGGGINSYISLTGIKGYYSNDIVSFQEYVGGDGNGIYQSGENIDLALGKGTILNLGQTQTNANFDGISRIIGSSYDDIFQGNDSDNYFIGLDGRDTAHGGDGNDILIGGFSFDSELSTQWNTIDPSALRTNLNTDVYFFSNYLGYYAIAAANRVPNIEIPSHVDFLSKVDSGYQAAYGHYGKVSFYDDVLYGDAGDDTLYGRGVLDGGAGNDSLYGNGMLMGGLGNDFLYGNGELFGGDGDDFISSGVTNYYSLFSNYSIRDEVPTQGIGSKVDGGNGNDTIYLNSLGGAGNVDGGTGIDLLIFQPFNSNNAIKLNFGDPSQTQILPDGTTITNIERLLFSGGRGNDIITGGVLNDTIDGGVGEDILNGGGGVDTLSGSIGYDTFILDNHAIGYNTTITDFYQYEDTIKLSGIFASFNPSTDKIDRFVQITHVGSDDILSVSVYGDGVFTQVATLNLNVSLSVAGMYASGHLIIDAPISTVGQTITGTIGNDILTGTSGNDTIYSLGGNDRVTAGDGNDLVNGGAGNDILDGGNGIDTISFQSSGATLFNLYLTSIQSTGSGYYDKVKNFENIIGSSFIDTLRGDDADNIIQGMGGNDYIEGKGGNDIIDGGVGFDTLTYQFATGGITVDLSLTTPQDTGGAGIDTITSFEAVTGSNYGDVLTGDSKNNIIKGGSGNDIIYGSGGLDNFWGGIGADIFVLKTANMYVGNKYINDFSQLEFDQVDIHDFLQSYDPVTDAIANFVQIATSGSNSILSIDANGGADNFVQIATIKGIVNITDVQALIDYGSLIV